MANYASKSEVQTIVDRSAGKVVDELTGVFQGFLQQDDERFDKVESKMDGMQKQIQNVLDHLDSIEKRLEISEDERLVMAHQLTLLHDWVEKAANRIDVKFAR